jgi:hypothetical protein
MKSFLWRILVIFHRYLGIAVGILMLLWFASGIVMMYVGFPRLTEQDRLSALAPIPWQACCRVADGLIPDDLQFTVSRLRISSACRCCGCVARLGLMR